MNSCVLCLLWSFSTWTGEPNVTAELTHRQAFVGDAIEEDIDELGHLAGELGLLGLPCFMFHEGHDPVAGKAFRQIARLSGGAYCPFDASSARQLRTASTSISLSK